MSEMMKRYPEILIYKDQYPYKAVESVSEASKETLVPVNTIYNMMLLKPKTKQQKKNGGRTTPDGWGFDVLFDNRQ
jgi:hypothetical protein